MEQELFTLLEHLSSPRVSSGVRVAQFFVLCVMFCRSLVVLLVIVLSVLLLFTRLLITPLVSSNFYLSGSVIIKILKSRIT